MPSDKKEEEIEVDLGRGRVLKGHPDAVHAYVDAAMAHIERNRRWPQTPEGEIDMQAAMTALVRSFPSLRGAADTDPWDVTRFVRWLCDGRPGGALRAGRFVLHVWNADADFRELGRELGIEGADECLKPFNLSEALGVWDEEHRKAFLAWAEAPVWP